jgi:hypothetical protein
LTWSEEDEERKGDDWNEKGENGDEVEDEDEKRECCFCGNWEGEEMAAEERFDGCRIGSDVEEKVGDETDGDVELSDSDDNCGTAPSNACEYRREGRGASKIGSDDVGMLRARDRSEDAAEEDKEEPGPIGDGEDAADGELPDESGWELRDWDDGEREDTEGKGGVVMNSGKERDASSDGIACTFCGWEKDEDEDDVDGEEEEKVEDEGGEPEDGRDCGNCWPWYGCWCGDDWACMEEYGGKDVGLSDW